MPDDQPGRTLSALVAAAVVSVAAVLAVSCGVGQSSGGASGSNGGGTTLEPEDPPVTGGKLVVAVNADVNGWNPCINQWSDAGSLMGPSMLEPLVVEDADGDPQPWLAESWIPDADFTTWTITMRDGVRFHNGQPLDAAAAKRSIDALALGALTRLVFGTVYDRAEVTGPRTVTVRLRRTFAQYPFVMANTYMLAPEMLDREDQGTVFPIGTGAFKFGTWNQGTSLDVVRWDGYWRRDAAGRTLPHLDRIEFRAIPDDDAREQALVAGTVDLALTTSSGTASRLESGYTVLRDYTSQRTRVILNTAEGADNAPNPFTNAHARKALAYATDRVAIAHTVGEKVESTTQARSPDSRWGLPPDQTGYYAHDPAAARREIEAYKAETGRDALRFRLLSTPASQDQTLLQAVIGQWRKVGAEASLETLDQVPFNTTVVLGRWHAALSKFHGDPNPAADYFQYASENAKPVGELSLNFTHYQSASLDRSIQSDGSTTDFAVRKSAYGAITREVNEQAVSIWLHDTPYAIVARRGVRGLNAFRQHPFGNFVAKPWWGDMWRSR
jgi:peptide/nickel transport system substrate-binding protein